MEKLEITKNIEQVNQSSSWKNYNLLVSSASIARIASSGFAVAVVWIALSLTGSPLIAGLSDGMMAAPLFLSFIFGAYVDRLQRKKGLAVVTTLGRGFSILLMLVSLAVTSVLLKTLQYSLPLS